MILTTFNFLIFIGLSISTILLTIYFSNRTKKNPKENSVIDYVLFGRQLTLPLFVATLVSSFYGNILGVSQIALKHGVYNIITQGVCWYLALIIFALFFLEKVLKMNVVSLPDMVLKLYGKKASKLLAILISMKTLPITYTLGAGILIKNLTGLNLLHSVTISILFVISYIGFKGLSSIIFSDAIQFILMFVAVAIVLFFSIYNFGGISFLTEKLPSHYFTISSNSGYTKVLLWLCIAIFTTCLSTMLYQRCFAAKSLKIAKTGIVISIIFWAIFDICVTLGGMYAKAIFPDANPYEAYFIYSMNILPDGFKGVYAAGMFATVLSTLDSVLFINNTTILYDICGKNLAKKYYVKILALIVPAIITIFFTMTYANDMEKLLILRGSYFIVPLFIPISISILFKKHITGKQFIFSVISSMLSMLLNDLVIKSEKIETFYIGVIVSFTSVLFSVLYSYNNSEKSI